MRKPPTGKVYSFSVQETVRKQLPKTVLDAMHICGWNEFGIYELVKYEIEQEKRAARLTQRRGQAK